MSDYADRFAALIDANVLACAMHRNIILSLAEAGFFRPRWRDKILDETPCSRRSVYQPSSGQRSKQKGTKFATE
jgi:hypothetical protein